MLHFDEKFWLAIAFFAFATLIIKFVWPLIAKGLDNKSKKIAEDILTAKDLREKAEKLLASAEKYYQESTDFAQKLLKDAEDEAKKLAADSRDTLEKEVSKKTAAALERIKIEEESAIREIKTKIVSTAIDGLSSKMDLDQKIHENLVEKSIKNFERIH